MKLSILPFLLITVTLSMMWSCGANSKLAENQGVMNANPPAADFNAADSDEEAIAIADKVMKAMGGRKNWDATRFMSWNFFGVRHLTWDKQTGRVRIQSFRDSMIYQINILDDSGSIMKDGALMTASDSIAKYTNRGKSIWINDAYWLVMPFKLKDSGVTLKHFGTDTIAGGKMADILQLTFEKVGDTPNNKYLVYVDQSDHLIKQWDFYTNAEDTVARFSTPWLDYKQHGQILLSGNRGQSQLTAIKVSETLPDSVFETFRY